MEIFIFTLQYKTFTGTKTDYLDRRPEDDDSKCCPLASPQKDREGKKHE
jgi:hypothetical protein